MITALDNIDIVSFDLYDTLINRIYPHPTDVFYCVALKFGFTHNQATRFKQDRVQAEHKSRNGVVETTLDLIYSSFNTEYTQAQLDKLKNLELAEELTCCIPNAQIIEYFHSIAKPKIIVSDTYLPELVIKKIVARLVGPNISVYVSSALNKTKASGSMFTYLKQQYKSNILHIGDNFYSDYTIPRSLGVQTYYYKVKKQQPNTLCLASVLSHLPPTAPWERIAFTNLLPILITFCQAIRHYVIEHKLQHTFFFSRDGLIIKEVYNFLYPDQPTSYVCASRRALTLAGITELTESNLSFLIGPNATTPYSVLSNLNIFVEPNPQLNQLFQPQDHKLHQILYTYSDQILNAIQTHRLSLRTYIEKVGLHLNNIAICDIGWHSTMQFALDSLRKQIWGTNETYGCYFGRFCATKPVQAFGYIHDCNPETEYTLWGDVAFMELLFSANEPPLAGFKDGEPVYATPTNSELQRMHVAERIHIGIQLGLQRIKTLNLTSEIIKESQIKTQFRSFLKYPPKEVCSLVASLQHSASFTNTDYSAIIPKFTLRGYDRAQWKHGYIQNTPRIIRPFVRLYHNLLCSYKTSKLRSKYAKPKSKD